jgi:nitrate reductase NapE
MTQDSRDAAVPLDIPPAKARRKELLAFLILAFGIWPIVAVGVVGGYGFLVWMYQIVFGPPGPPGG